MDTSDEGFKNTVIVHDTIYELMIENKDKIKTRSWYDGMKMHIMQMEQKMDEQFDWEKYNNDQPYNLPQE